MPKRAIQWRRLELPEITLIDEIEEHVRAVEARGRKVVRVSTWDLSDETAQLLRIHVPVELPQEEFYRYSYSYVLKRARNGWDDVLKKLGFEGATAAAQVMENGTAALAAVANALGLAGVRKVSILGPCYFAVPVALKRFGLQVEHVALPRKHNTYTFPTSFRLRGVDAIWVTHPIYSTGVYSLEQYLDELEGIANDGTLVIADEVLALPPSRIAARLGGHPNFIGIYAPHKAVSINRLKFSLIAFHPDVGDVFDHWADVLHGGLSWSASAAVAHFSSARYDEHRRYFTKVVDEVRNWHTSLALEFQDTMQIDEDARGYFVSVYFPQIDAGLGNDLSFHKRLVDETGCSVIPGSRGGFDNSLGFAFRINLAAFSPQLLEAAPRLYRFLAGISRRSAAGRRDRPYIPT